MTLARRIIPCLDVDAGRVVKGVEFQGLRDMGDPAELGARYNEEGADELVVLDISASFERKLVARLAHLSQTGDAAALEEAFRQRAEEIGRPAGLALAEAFKRIFF